MTASGIARFITAMVTPFDADLNLDLNRTEQLADRLIQGGNEALLACGTTGESPTVFYPQKIEVIKAMVRAADGRVPVYANVGDNCTADTIEFARDVQDLGVSALMCVVPYYNKPPQEGLYRHFRTIAEAVDLPVILYNIPGRCVTNMTAETTLRLAHDVPNIVAVKEASGDMQQVRSIIEDAPSGFSVLSGDDATTYDIMSMGGHGVISTIGNVAPALMRRIVDLAAQGSWDEARAAHEHLLPLMKGLFATTNPILVKEALNLLGFPVGGVRLPLVPATPAQRVDLTALMRQVGLQPTAQ
ncbi:4-hydroxy-tetrahydrodipicolinate synthase [Eggerthellaceae bacterium zg-1084]|uniref:4-hydroxy-tetrahydrodipicolinate synthase n=1 Tax=Berryella wangjianweii TaxID=2734634 RepID=UPI0015517DA9|nr:4-hydroxy-tetrahydrodipicolinate synthase [Berryella wangjianweii]NPD30300.1 4-hydroxy-tetrahydrodipicolinate synthase [Berryella wangjianweii]